MNKITYGKQNISNEDIQAVVDVLKSDFLTQGPKVEEFEKDLSNYCGAKYTKVVCNASSALHLAYLAIGLAPNDIVWTSANTFVATANAGIYCGAKVDFVDIDSKTYNMSIKDLKNKLIKAKKENKLPKLVVPVHFAGQSCEMEDIWILSKEYGFKVIEDASHALGGEYKNDKVGCCKYCDMAIFSFHPVKMITTGEGGAITTNNKKLDEKVSLLRSHGITKDKAKFIKSSNEPWYYEQQELGYNYRLTDMQSALGISQLKRLDDFVSKRRGVAKRYAKLHNVTLPYQHPDTNSSWHLFVIQTKHRAKLYDYLKENNIFTQVHYLPVNEQPFYNQKALIKTSSFYKQCLSIPMFVDLEEKSQDMIMEKIQEFINDISNTPS